MYDLLDSPRQDFTRQQILNYLAEYSDVKYEAGLEVVDTNGLATFDISQFLRVDKSPKIKHDSYANIHGTCELTLNYPGGLQWGVTRVRPYMTLDSSSARLGDPLVNLCTTPSFEYTGVGLGGWSPRDAGGSTTTVATSTVWSRTPGTTSAKVTCSVASAFTRGAQFTLSGLVVGKTYTCSIWVRLNTTFTGSVGAFILSGPTGTSTTVKGVDQQLYVTFTATATSHTFLVGSATFTATQFFYIDQAVFVTGTIVEDYFDGDTADTLLFDYAWTGTKGNSTSTATPKSLPPARFNLGVYTLTSVTGIPLGVALPDYTVVGYDNLYLLDQPITSTISFSQGVPVLDAVRQTIGRAPTGVVPQILLDSTSQGRLLAPMTFPVGTGDVVYTWLTVVNSLLAAIGYRGLWCDVDGNYRSEPYREPAMRAEEFWFVAEATDDALIVDPDIARHTIVAPESRTFDNDMYNIPNRWVFVQNGRTTRPVVDDGLYIVDNVYEGPTSQVAIGRIIAAPAVFLDATGQGDLIKQGNATVAKMKNWSEIITVQTAPLPIAGHFDVVRYDDPSLQGISTRKMLAHNWELPLDGSDMTWTWEAIVDAQSWYVGPYADGSAVDPGGVIPSFATFLPGVQR